MNIRWTPEQLADYRKRRQGSSHMTGVDIDAVHRNQPKQESKLEIRFAQQLADSGIFPAKEDEPMGYVRNYLNAIPGRNFELDIAWPRLCIYVEIDGGAHRTKGRFAADFEKHALLLLAGWRGLRVGGRDVKEGRAIEWTKELLRQ